jgi:hypothetical protein
MLPFYCILFSIQSFYLLSSFILRASKTFGVFKSFLMKLVIYQKVALCRNLFQLKGDYEKIPRHKSIHVLNSRILLSSLCFRVKLVVSFENAFGIQVVSPLLEWTFNTASRK